MNRNPLTAQPVQGTETRDVLSGALVDVGDRDPYDGAFQAPPTAGGPGAVLAATRLAATSNLTLANTSRIAALVAAVLAQTGNMHLVSVGDSTDRGYMATDYVRQSPTGAMVSILRSWGVPAELGFVAPPSIIGGAVADERFTPNGWTNHGSGIASSCGFSAGAVTTPLSFRPGVAADRIDVPLYKNSGLGTITLNFGGGADVVVPCAGAAGFTLYTVTAPAVRSDNVLTVASSGTNTFFHGGCPYRSDLKQVLVGNAAANGSTTTNHNNSTNSWGTRQLLTVLGANMGVLLGCGVNEGRSNVSAATYQSDQRDLASFFLPTRDVVLHSMLPSGNGTGTQVVPREAEYVPVQKALSAELGIPHADLYGRYGGVYQAALMADFLHGKEAIYAEAAQVYLAGLRGVLGI